MSSVLYQDIEQTQNETQLRGDLQCESALRVAAATLCQATSGEISATTVVCDVHESDSEMLESLVADIATECDLDAEIRQRDGVFSVRFVRPIPECAPNARGYSVSRMLGSAACRLILRLALRKSTSNQSCRSTATTQLESRILH